MGRELDSGLGVQQGGLRMGKPRPARVHWDSQRVAAPRNRLDDLLLDIA